MHIDVTFGGALIRFVTEGTQGNRQTIKTEDGVTLSRFLEQIGIASDERLLVILNGKLIQPPEYTRSILADRDNLSLMPPIQAG